MSWNNQGGGQGPWGNRGPSGNGNGSQGGPQTPPPNIDAILRLVTEWFHRLTGGGGGGKRGGEGLSLALLVIGVIFVLWMATGIYRVLPDEQGVVLRFGAYSETTGPGLHYHLPAPFEMVLRPKVTRVMRTDIGMVLDPDSGNFTETPEESLMLTGDENIVDINLSVFWVVKDARSYLFDIRDPDASVKSATESAVREIVGRTPIASVLAEGRAKIEIDTLTLLQKILDSYGAGIQVTQVQLQKADPPQPVIEAFRDVQRARTDGERMRNEAQAYANDIIPRARGDSQRLIQGAEAYRQQTIAQAQGDSQRFLEVYNAWKAAKDVTSERLYLETMEQVLKNANTIIMERGASSSGLLPYLPLGAKAPPAVPTAPASSSSDASPPQDTPPAQDPPTPDSQAQDSQSQDNQGQEKAQ